MNVVGMGLRDAVVVVEVRARDRKRERQTDRMPDKRTHIYRSRLMGHPVFTTLYLSLSTEPNETFTNI